MKTRRTVFAVLALAAAILTPTLKAHAAHRGDAVDVTGHAVNAVRTCPVLRHGDSGFSGGALWLAPKQTATDAHCAAAPASRGARPVPVVPDRTDTYVANIKTDSTLR